MSLRATLAVPGELKTLTGGYGYARRLLQAALGVGLRLDHLALPDGFPTADGAALAEAGRRLACLPTAAPVIVDGLALGVMDKHLAPVKAPLIALCHHPLGLETGLSPQAADALISRERAALRLAAHVIATSRATAGTLATSLDVPPAKISVARPGTERPLETTAHGRASGPLRLLSVGSLTHRKGHDLLIGALARLTDLDWQLTIAGPDRDRAFAARLRAGIAETGLAERVRLVGALDDSALASAYEQADLFVLCSRYEGYGMAFTEAMAWGLPVVGPDVDAVREATLGAACLVPPGKLGALAAALRPLLEAPDARAALAERCRDAAERLPTWTATAEAVADVVGRVQAQVRE